MDLEETERHKSHESTRRKQKYERFKEIWANLDEMSTYLGTALLTTQLMSLSGIWMPPLAFFDSTKVNSRRGSHSTHLPADVAGAVPGVVEAVAVAGEEERNSDINK